MDVDEKAASAPNKPSQEGSLGKVGFIRFSRFFTKFHRNWFLGQKKKMSRVMNESSEENETGGIVPTLQAILQELTDAQECVKRLLAFERRARREDESVESALRKLRRRVMVVREDLGMVEAPGEVKKKKKREREEEKQGRHAEEEGEEAVVEEGELEDKELSRERRQKVREYLDSPQQMKIMDGAAARFNGSLLYFGLMNAKEGRMWVCPYQTAGGTVSVDRKQLQMVEYGALSEEEQAWFLRYFEIDLFKRFEVNFPVLFSNSGREMIDIRRDLIDDPASVRIGIETLAKRTEVGRVAAKVSPYLSSTNNTALMLAAKMHETAMATMADNPRWYDEFLSQLKDLCQRCDLKVGTVQRYWKVGELMLKCKVLTCMLPSFVALHMEHIEDLLGDEVVLRRLEAAFEEQLVGEEQNVELERDYHDGELEVAHHGTTQQHNWQAGIVEVLQVDGVFQVDALVQGCFL